MAYRNKTYIAFDGDNDIRYYNLMKAWKQNDNTDFDFYNAHDLNTASDESKEESIKAQLRERLKNSKVFVILIGENTRFLTKFVKWEIETAIKMGLPIISVNLNDSKKSDYLCPKSLQGQLSIFIPFKSAIMQYALENWPASHNHHKSQNQISHYYYPNKVYEDLGLLVASS